LDTLFKKPIINLTMLLSDSGVFNRKTVTQILNKLTNKEYIKVLRKGAGSSPTIFVFPALYRYS
jgi:hypothetical protein